MTVQFKKLPTPPLRYKPKFQNIQFTFVDLKNTYIFFWPQQLFNLKKHFKFLKQITLLYS